jgi:hypothetical protein
MVHHQQHLEMQGQDYILKLEQPELQLRSQLECIYMKIYTDFSTSLF